MAFPRLIFAACLTIVITAAPIRADEAFWIKFKELTAGQTGSYVVLDSSDVDVQVDGLRGRVLVHHHSKIQGSYYFWERIEERRPGEAPLRSLRGYSAAKLNVDGEQTILAMEGKRVQIDRRGARPTYVIEGMTHPVRRQREFVDAELTDDFHVTPYLPNRPVRVNEVYAIDGKPLSTQISVSAPGVELELNRVEARGWLAAVYDNQGHRFGRIVTDVRVPVNAFTNDGARFALVQSERLTLQSTFDICIDGTAHAGTIRTVPHLSVNSQNLRFNVRVVVTGERTVTMGETSETKR